MALILGAAPRLGDMLARQPQIMDGLIDPRFFGAMPDQRELSMRLAATLEDANAYEEFLDRLRLFGQESLFLIGTRILSGTVSAQQASVAFADVAEGIVHTVHGLVTDRFAAQHGRIKGQQTAILAMGRLGSREMTASSDLDLILLYDFDHDYPDSDGERSLHGAQYFARFTQRLISAFTTRTNYGVLYDVDMRLRPSGRAGPVASRIDSFADYQEREAWTWEHMALTRARVISAPPEFRARIESIIRAVLTRPRDRAGVASDVADMRRAIALEKGEDDVWDLKYAAGGMVDIDFIAQYLQLVHAADKPEILDVSTLQVLDNAARLGVLPQSAAETLRSATRLYHDLTQILRLCVTEKFKPETAGDDLLARAGAGRRCAGLLLAGGAGQGDPDRGAAGVRGYRRRKRQLKSLRRHRHLRLGLAGVARQRDADHGAGAELGAQLHRPAVQIGQRPRDRQPQPRAVIGLGQLALDLLERPAQPQQRMRRDADAGVGDHQHDGIAEHPAAHHHLAAIGRELDRIGQQVDDDLLDRAAIGHHRNGAVDIRVERSGACRRRARTPPAAIPPASSTGRAAPCRASCGRPRSSTCRGCR